MSAHARELADIAELDRLYARVETMFIPAKIFMETPGIMGCKTGRENKQNKGEIQS